MILPVLYHWAPTTPRKSIRTEGLMPFQAPTVCTGEHVSPYLSLSPDPALELYMSATDVPEDGES